MCKQRPNWISCNCYIWSGYTEIPSRWCDSTRHNWIQMIELLVSNSVIELRVHSEQTSFEKNHFSKNSWRGINHSMKQICGLEKWGSEFDRILPVFLFFFYWTSEYSQSGVLASVKQTVWTVNDGIWNTSIYKANRCIALCSNQSI